MTAFLGLLAGRRREQFLGAICEEALQLLDEREGVETAHVTAAKTAHETTMAHLDLIAAHRQTEWFKIVQAQRDWLDAVDAEHGVYLVPDDAGGGTDRRYAPRGRGSRQGG